ncbi:hypothetical protein AAHA92_23282 [Salvia divinorum]|uniref:Uncharacterized protein n=1 Tax=Salvia divinorum TaxID=28513 RepID=A0ABD1GUC4_SALDI
METVSCRRRVVAGDPASPPTTGHIVVWLIAKNKSSSKTQRSCLAPQSPQREVAVHRSRPHCLPPVLPVSLHTAIETADSLEVQPCRRKKQLQNS